MNLEVFSLISKLIPVVTEVVADAKALDGLEGQARLDKIVELAMGGLDVAEIGLNRDLMDNARFEAVVRQAVALVGEVQELIAAIRA